MIPRGSVAFHSGTAAEATSYESFKRHQLTISILLLDFVTSFNGERYCFGSHSLGSILFLENTYLCGKAGAKCPLSKFQLVFLPLSLVCNSRSSACKVRYSVPHDRIFMMTGGSPFDKAHKAYLRPRNVTLASVRCYYTCHRPKTESLTYAP